MLIAQQKLQHNFSRASREYDARAEFQHVQTRRVLDAALMIMLEKATIADIGCGTGYFAAAAKAKRPEWKIFGVDIAVGMCTVAATRCTAIAGDAVQLPLADSSVDAVVSSLCYQWVKNHDVAFAELVRVLKPGGRAVVATLGAESLIELRASAEEAQLPLSLLTMRTITDNRAALMRSGLEISFADCMQETRYYPSVAALLDSMRSIGAGNNFANGARGLVAPKRWAAMISSYEERRTATGIPATWEHQFFVLHKPL